MINFPVESSANPHTEIVTVEWLRYKVPINEREAFIKNDDGIWTPFLSKCPGYVDKKVWISSDSPEDIFIIVRWSSREEWKSIPEELLDQTLDKFNSAVGKEYPILESKEFQEVK